MSLSCTVYEILSLIPQKWKRSRDSKHIPFVGIYHACTSTPVYQSAHEIWSALLHKFQKYKWNKIEVSISTHYEDMKGDTKYF